MEINWQNVFYVTTSLAMIVLVITCIWLMRLLFIFSKLINNLAEKTRKLNDIASFIRYFNKGIKLKILEFLSKILDKGGEKYDKSKSKKTK